MKLPMSRSERLRRRRRIRAREWTVAVLLAVSLAVMIRIFVFEPFNVVGPSMQTTLETGNLILVNKLVYRFGEPRRGEVVVFHAPHHKDYVKRVIALPGETVEAKNNKILINGKIMEEPYLVAEMRTRDFDLVKVPPGKVFVLGDNRLDSTDSRVIGPIGMSAIVGRAEIVYWPFNHWKLL
ncbi:signal peptidase I [Laceyella putida]|uniref:Signal peptidase I n=1 Tax=Laceyella putida TaxID=110101 RepID=A0ABW2RNR4_9BACL